MLDMLRFRIASRAEFERPKAQAQAPETLTDLERAARFPHLQKLAFGGKVAGRGFGVDNRQGARFNVARLEPLLADIHERLAGVTIEQLGYGDFIRRYDRPGMLFYIDPPHWGCKKDYGQDVSAARTSTSSRCCSPASRTSSCSRSTTRRAYRSTFAAFRMVEAEMTYTVGAGAGVKAAELIISSVPPR